MKDLFYAPGIGSDHYTFSTEESNHMIRVMRMGKGEQVRITDGKGNLFTAELDDVNPAACIARITGVQHEAGKRKVHLHLAVAPPKNIDRFEWFLEKATEIGIEEITPIRCRHSERKEIKPERQTKVLIAAMKQSQKSYLPVLNPMINFNELIKIKMPSGKFICSMNASADFNSGLKNLGELLVLVGPEGDFSSAEYAEANNAGFNPVTLGHSRLRTETAAVMACAAVSLSQL